MAPKWPTNVMSHDDFKAKSENYEKLMDRTWYLIGNNLQAKDLDCFWEINTWNTADHKQGPYCATNFTASREKKNGKWNADCVEGYKLLHPININKDYAQLVLKSTAKGLGLPCGRMPFTLGKAAWQHLNFPENDSFNGFWTYVLAFGGNKMVWVFALTPNVPDELYQAELKRIQAEHDIPASVIAKMFKVEWPGGGNYKLGDTGEESINQDGKGSTVKDDYTAKRVVKADEVKQSRARA